MPKIEYTTPSKATNEATKELINALHRHIAGTNSAYSTYNVERDRNKGLYTEAALAAQAAQAQESGRRAVAQQMEDTRAAVLAEIEKMRSALYAWIRYALENEDGVDRGVIKAAVSLAQDALNDVFDQIQEHQEVTEREAAQHG